MTFRNVFLFCVTTAAFTATILSSSSYDVRIIRRPTLIYIERTEEGV